MVYTEKTSADSPKEKEGPMGGDIERGGKPIGPYEWCVRRRLPHKVETMYVPENPILQASVFWMWRCPISFHSSDTSPLREPRLRHNDGTSARCAFVTGDADSDWGVPTASLIPYIAAVPSFSNGSLQVFPTSGAKGLMVDTSFPVTR